MQAFFTSNVIPEYIKLSTINRTSEVITFKQFSFVPTMIQLLCMFYLIGLWPSVMPSKFRCRASHELNRMLMRENKGFSHLHLIQLVKYGA